MSGVPEQQYPSLISGSLLDVTVIDSFESGGDGPVPIGSNGHNIAAASNLDGVFARAALTASNDDREVAADESAGSVPAAFSMMPAAVRHRLSSAVEQPEPNSAASQLANLKAEVKAEFAKEFTDLKSNGVHLDQDVYDALRSAVDSAESTNDLKELRSTSLRSQIFLHADSVAGKLGAGKHSAGEDLLVVMESISNLGPDQAKKHCVEALKSYFGISRKDAKEFLTNDKTCHRDAPLMLRRELEEIASARFVPAKGEYANQREALQSILRDRQATRELLRQCGGDEKLIEKAMWGAGTDRLKALRDKCDQPNAKQPDMRWLSEFADKTAKSKSAVLDLVAEQEGDFACRNLLMTRFGFSAAKAKKLLNDAKTPNTKQPRVLQKELLEVARLTEGPKRTHITWSYKAVQNVLNARQSARGLLDAAHHPDPDAALRNFINVKKLTSFTAADAGRLAEAAKYIHHPEVSKGPRSLAEMVSGTDPLGDADASGDVDVVSLRSVQRSTDDDAASAWDDYEDDPEDEELYVQHVPPETTEESTLTTGTTGENGGEDSTAADELDEIDEIFGKPAENEKTALDSGERGETGAVDSTATSGTTAGTVTRAHTTPAGLGEAIAKEDEDGALFPPELRAAPKADAGPAVGAGTTDFVVGEE